MKRGGVGGANTKTGLAFELKTDLPTFIAKQNGYSIHNIDRNTTRSRKTGKITIGTKLRKNCFRWRIDYQGEEVAQIFQQDGLYRYFDEIEGYDYTKIISARIKPDEAIFVIENNTVFIIEKKTQSGGGSVDEKL